MMAVKKKITTTKRKSKNTVKILPMIILTGEDGQSFTYKAECGFISEEKFKLYDSLLGKKISIQFAMDKKTI